MVAGLRESARRHTLLADEPPVQTIQPVRVVAVEVDAPDALHRVTTRSRLLLWTSVGSSNACCGRNLK